MEKGEPWQQAIIGTLSNPISQAYFLDDENVPAAILIGPDGTVISSSLYNNKIVEGVREALKRVEK